MILFYSYDVQIIRPEGTTRETSVFLKNNNLVDGLLFKTTTPKEMKVYTPVAGWRLKGHRLSSTIPLNEEMVLSSKIKSTNG